MPNNISVIIPSYKPQFYIYSCLESLKKQSYNKFEIIIVLNGCHEPYYSQIQQYIQTLDLTNTHIIQTDTPGVSNARNIGLNLAKGQYITFIDDDDIISSNYLEDMLKKVTPNSIVVSNVFGFESNLSNLKKDYLTMASNTYKGLIHERKYLSNSCCKLIPISIIGTVRFLEHFTNGEDALFMFQLSNRIKYINKSSENCIYYRRIRENSASRRKTSLSKKFKRIIKQQIAYTQIIFRQPTQYNWILYFTRLLAVLKQ